MITINRNRFGAIASICTTGIPVGGIVANSHSEYVTRVPKTELQIMAERRIAEAANRRNTERQRIQRDIAAIVKRSSEPVKVTKPAKQTRKQVKINRLLKRGN